MNNQDDNELHDFVRAKIASYQPEYHQADWEAMRSKLPTKRRYRRLVILIGLFLGITASVFWIHTNNKNASVPVLTKKLKQQIPPKQIEIYNSIASPKLSLNKKSLRLFDVPTKSNEAPVIQETEPPQRPLINLQTSTLQKNNIIPNSYLSLPKLEIDIDLLKTELEISNQLHSGSFGTDSTTFKTFERNINRWKNTVVVCDFTSSMYPFSTQLYAWFKKNENNPNIMAIVFFTDCDSLGHEIQKSKNRGKMFVTTDLKIESLLPTMISATRNTKNNTDDPENDIEGLLFAQLNFPKADNLVLIADNSSAVKGMNQLYKIKKRTHVILCGETGDTTQPIQPNYFKIASRTNGSLHTLEDDIQNPNRIEKNKWIRVGNRYFRYKKGEFEISDFMKRPKRILGLFWM